MSISKKWRGLDSAFPFLDNLLKFYTMEIMKNWIWSALVFIITLNLSQVKDMLQKFGSVF